MLPHVRAIWGDALKYCAACHATYASDYESCPVDKSVLRSTSELLQGMIIRGKYEILDKIGSGGMAAVYRARHVHLDETRAIKVVRSAMAEDENFVRRLRAEAIISRKLHHPNAVRVDDLDELEDGRPFIAMEYVEGHDLRKIIHQEGPLAFTRVVEITRQIASALAAAHRLGIVHRDIKPDNIVLVPQTGGAELVKVLDFGIAKLHSLQAQGRAMTLTGVVLCTPEYASPEQVRGGSTPIDGRADIYSLGMVMYEMLTGELPFHSDTPLGMLLAQINAIPKSPAELKPDLNIPPELSAILMKMLEKDPGMRFQTADELLQALADLNQRQTLAASAPPTTAAYLTGELEHAYHQQRQRKRIGVAVAFLLVLLSVGFWLWNQRFRHRPPPVPASTTDVADELVIKKVATALRDSHLPGIENVHPRMVDGTIRLEGQAPSRSVADEAAETAAKVSGYVVIKDVQIVPGTTTVAGTAAPPQEHQEQGSKAPDDILRTGAPSTPAQTESGSGTQPQPGATPMGGVQPGMEQRANLTGNPQPGTGQPVSSPPPASSATVTQAAVPLSALVHQLPAAPADKATPPSDKTPPNPRVAQLLASARDELDQGKFDDAINDYDAILRIDHNNRAAQRGRANAISAKKYYNSVMKADQ